jgi:hypothetical protein
VSCDDSKNSSDDVTPGTVTYISTAGELTYTLAVTQNLNRAAYAPQANDTYTLEIAEGTTIRRSNGRITNVSVTAGNTVLRLSNGTNLSVTINITGMINIDGTINIAGGQTHEASGSLTPEGTKDGDDGDIITAIAVAGITLPVVGNTPVTALTNVTVTTTPTGAATVSAIEWFLYTDNDIVPHTDIFSNNRAYAVIVTLTAASGYTFTGLAADADVTINGSDVTRSATNNGANIILIRAIILGVPDYGNGEPVDGPPFYSIDRGIRDWLWTQTGGNDPTDPIDLPVRVALGNMADTASNWRQLVFEINFAGKYVNLDLSASTMNGTIFDPTASGSPSIVSIILPNAATSIANGIDHNHAPFRYFNSLRSFSGARLTSIGNFAFAGVRSLNMTSLPSGITSIGDLAFRNCENLALTALPPGLTHIGESAFRWTSITITEFPPGITAISAHAFRDISSLTQITLHEGITSIGLQAFFMCENLTEVTLPASLTSWGDLAFARCTSLTQINFAPGLASIGDYAFQDNESLEQITLPLGLTSIGTRAFYNCVNLYRITSYAVWPPARAGTGVFGYDRPGLEIRVPAGSLEDYQTRWREYEFRIIPIGF